MHGSQGFMVDNLPNLSAEPEDRARGWGMVIYYNSHGYRASTDYRVLHDIYKICIMWLLLHFVQ